MKNKQNVIKIVIALVLVFGISLMQHTPSAIADVPLQTDASNVVHIDVTYDPGTKTFSAGGFSSQELKQFGVPDLPDNIWAILTVFDNLTMKIIGDEIQLLTDEKPLFNMAFDENARAFVYDMVGAYLQTGKIDRERAEKWLEQADFDITLRKTKELSAPLQIQLATLLQVKIDQNGALSVEGIPTGMGITPETAELLRAANIENAKICWNKGVVNGEVNGSILPQMTIYEDGVIVIDKALGLNLGDLGPIFESSFGAGLVYAEGAPVAGECLP